MRTTRFAQRRHLLSERGTQLFAVPRDALPANSRFVILATRRLLTVTQPDWTSLLAALNPITVSYELCCEWGEDQRARVRAVEDVTLFG